MGHWEEVAGGWGRCWAVDERLQGCIHRVVGAQRQHIRLEYSYTHWVRWLQYVAHTVCCAMPLS